MATADFFEEITQSIASNSLADFFEVLYEISGSGTSLEAILNFSNTRKETLLHLASAKLQHEIVRLLLLNGANPNAQDINGETPVFVAIASLKGCACDSCTRNCILCLQFLGESGGNMNVGNKGGETPLHMAAVMGNQDIVLELLKHGASITESDGSSRATMNILLEEMPDIILPIFDRAIVMDRRARNRSDFQLAFDMSVLLLNGNEIQNSGTVHDPRREMGFLRQILRSNALRDVSIYQAILQHPVVHVFTDIKWSRLKVIYLAYLAFQLNLIIWYMLFLFLVIFVDCPVPAGTPTLHFNKTAIFSSIKETFFTSPKCEVKIYTKLVAVYVLLCTLMSGAKEIYHFALDFWTYIADIFNYAQCLGVATMIATTIIVLDPIALFHFWLFPLASFGMGICWLQLFLHFGQMPSLALYVDMFSKVTVNFCVSLAIYSFIIFAFAMSYCMLFPPAMKLIDIPFAILRIMTMMIGELDFESLFAPDKWFRNPLLAHLWYAIFLVIISMVLMNLLVGLAVSDIGTCRKDSEMVVMKRQITYLNYLEKSVYLATLFLPRCLKIFVRNRVSVIASSKGGSGVVHCKTRVDDEKTKKYTVLVYPNKKCDVHLSGLTRTSISQWILKQERTGSQGTFCKRELKQFQKIQPHHPAPQPIDGDDHRQTSPSSDKSSTKTRKRSTDFTKRLTKIENSLQRLDTSLFEFRFKLDHIQSLASKSNQSHI